MEQLSPAQNVVGLINSHVVARCVQVIAEFGVADAMDDRPVTANELAAQTGMDADALARILRLLIAHGLFAQEGEGYVHTPASELLRTNHPQSLRSYARMIGMPLIWNDFTQFGQIAKTGKPILDWAGLVGYFSSHPEEAGIFNEAMVGKASSVVPAIIDAYDFAAFRVVADVGGGRGHLLQAILQQAQEASGILFELPHVITDAAGAQTPRLQLVAGDFFADALPVADGYILMEVLHDWNDEDAAKIMSAVRRVAPAHARVLIVETMIPESAAPHFGKVLDIIMLAVTGGRERTAAEYERLLRRTGFRLERVIPTASQYSIVEAVVG